MNNLPNDIEIAGFTLGYCDDGSVYLKKEGHDGVSVRNDYLAEALNKLYENKPAIIKYWKVEIFIEGQDMALIGYRKPDDNLHLIDDSSYISVLQNTTGFDHITIPLSRVTAIKSYAVTE